MVEGVEEFRAELALDAFGELEFLAQRGVGVEVMRAEEPVPGGVAESAGGRAVPGAARTAVGIEQGSGGRGIETALPAGTGGSGGEPSGGTGIRDEGAAHQVGAARAGVRVATAVDVGRGERNAGLPAAHAGHLPASDDEIGHPPGAFQVVAALADGEFVESVEVGDEAANAVFPAVIDVVVPEEVIVGEIEGAGPRKVSL